MKRLALTLAAGLAGLAGLLVHGLLPAAGQEAETRPAAVVGDERVLDYHSDVTVAKDGWLTVVETIRVRCQGQKIAHGIYRDFPVRYRLPGGNRRLTVPFAVMGVQRDGKPEAWHMGNLPDSDFRRVYAGKEGVLLPPGIYTYKLTYRTTRQIGFFPDHDELYWNVTGNRWDFPIDAASATVTLPPAVPRDQIHCEAYTGREGAKGQDYKTVMDAAGRATFRTTAPLAGQEGLTIVVTFPKGIVAPPRAAASGPASTGAAGAAGPTAAVEAERPSLPGERILDYRSDVTVAKDGWLTVVETIRVRCERDKIKHGIYREFPVQYRGPMLGRYIVPFEVVSVLRDGKPEPWHTKNSTPGFRSVYAGEKDVLLKPGIYTYTFTYRTARQVGFFPGHDELYWNVTGNLWQFPIDAISATVTLPPGVPRDKIHVEGYTGLEHAKGQDYKAEVDSAGRALFHTTHALPLAEGLTIVVTLPKGFVSEPTATGKVRQFLADNCMVLVALVGLLVVAGYYFFAWLAVGRDPRKGVVFPLFQAPEGLSPSAVRYVLRMGYDNTCFAAGVLSLAVKRCLTIIDDDGDYALDKDPKGREEGLTRDETKLAHRLFASTPHLVMRNTNAARFQDSINGLKEVLAAEFKGPRRYFVSNAWWFVLGMLLSLLTLGGVAMAALRIGRNEEVPFLALWLSIWSIGVFFLVRQVIVNWRAVGKARRTGGPVVGRGPAISLTVFSVPFVIGEVVVGGMIIYKTSIWMLPILALIGLLNVWFFQLLKRPTSEGRKVMDQIEGLRMYLGTAERDLLNAATPPAKTPELFEKFLPYALALGVENAWADKFADVLAQASSLAEGGWQPTWYTGAAWSTLGATAFASSFSGSFTSALSTASTAPGSSSGSGGGGSSGGGGGGGGGGGW